jgi:ABC-2 type transport system ATP-binding protein
MRDIQDLCRRVVILDRGRRIYDGDLAEIVRRFSQQKELTLTFAAPVDRQEMSDLAAIVRFDSMEVTLKVDRRRLPAVIAKILSAHEVVDLSATELPVEDIIATVFTGCAAGRGVEGSP